MIQLLTVRAQFKVSMHDGFLRLLALKLLLSHGLAQTINKVIVNRLAEILRLYTISVPCCTNEKQACA